MEENKKCENCRFWHKWTSHDRAGDCQRKAPIAKPEGCGFPDPCNAIWPVTSSGLYCGDWRPQNPSDTHLARVEKIRQNLQQENEELKKSLASTKAEAHTLDTLARCTKNTLDNACAADWSGMSVERRYDVGKIRALHTLYVDRYGRA